jgi:ATP-dependent DNA helicase RecG
MKGLTENQYTEKKSLKIISGKTTDWIALAKECVAFANSRGGYIAIGIEDDNDVPPQRQKINPDLPPQIQKRISELTINTGIVANIEIAENAGEYILLQIMPSNATIASTTDGKYYYRSADTSVPLLPDELSRLFTDKSSFIWETKALYSVPRIRYNQQKMENFIFRIQNSERVSPFVKNKTPDELFDYYLMADGDYLTNLGVLWIGTNVDRAKLSYAPVIQFLKYDDNGNRINKIVWDDYSLNPIEMLEDIWEKIPDWKEGVEISDGLFRKFVSNYEEEVIRELLTNALVHRPYTTRGDIFINLYPDRLEIRNPGLLPIGVTPKNILHKTIRRNEKLAKIFYDLQLMEREGSGYDKIYEILLANGKQLPVVSEDSDSVLVVIKKQILKAEIVSFVNKINDEFNLNQKEIISLGLLAQNTTLSAGDFVKKLGLSDDSIKTWIGRLIEYKIISFRGKTRGMEYFINPQVLQQIKFKGKTNLKKIEDYRLKELIYQDLSTYNNSPIGEIHERIGKEIKIRKIKYCLDVMKKENTVISSGTARWTRYSINNLDANS